MKIIVFLIDFYQKYIRIYKKPSCVFYPSCSTYSKQAFLKYGFFKGFYLSFKRVLRCHPWQKNHIDNLK